MHRVGNKTLYKKNLVFIKQFSSRNQKYRKSCTCTFRTIVNKRNHTEWFKSKRMKANIIAIFQNGKQGDLKTTYQLGNKLDMCLWHNSKTDYAADGL